MQNPLLTYHVLSQFAYNWFIYNGARGGSEYKTKIKIECISRVLFVVDSNRIPEYFLTKQWSETNGGNY